MENLEMTNEEIRRRDRTFDTLNLNIWKDFNIFGIYVFGYTNEKNEIKKGCFQPKQDKYTGKKKYIKNVFNYITGKFVEPNGIQIDTSNISVIDVDQPEKCAILDKLIRDAKMTVKTRKGYHFYFKKCNEIPRDEYCGIADINIQKLWYVPKYYHNETKEEYNYELIRDYPLEDMPQYAIDWCNMLISMNPKKDKTKIIKSNVEKLIVQPDIIIEKFNIKIMESIYNILFDAGLFNKYKDWLSVGYMGRHLNNSEQSFKLYDKYSRKVDGYENNDEYNNRKAFYGNNEYNLNFDENGILLKCMKLNPAKYKTTLQHLYKSKYDNLIEKVDLKYIYDDNDTIFKNWMESDCKALTIKSVYGSGKTHAFKQILQKYNPKRVLFITYRQSLAVSFSKDLKDKYGFLNYLDDKEEIKNADRAIIQLDSLYKVKGIFNYLTQQDATPAYDMIILDECEGLLNHFSFGKIDQYNIHQILSKLLIKTKKILMLDGDMGDRSYDFISTIEPDIKYKFIVNEYKGILKNFLFTQDIEKFDKLIDDDLKNKKKIVIVCMTKTESDRFNDKYKDKYNICLHNSFERNKDILKDVNTNWAKCDLLIYSPSVESGVDFNIMNYFYRCYATLSHQSTSYRAFFQMLNRVRYFENNEIYCLMGFRLEYKVNDLLCRFDEMRLEKWNNIELNNLTNILIHNDVERYNSSKHFMTCIIKTLKNKGHSYKYLNDAPSEKRKKLEPTQTELIKQSIIKIDDINEIKFEKLITKQKENKDLTREENLMIIKHLYKKAFLTDTIDETFMEEHYNKFEVLKNYKLSILNNENKIKDKTEYLKNFKLEKIDEIHKLLNQLNYKIVDGSLKEVNEKPVIFNDIKDTIKATLTKKSFMLLFETDRDIKENNVKYALNDLLKNYGFEIDDEKFRKYIIDPDNKDKKKRVWDYKIKVNEIKIIQDFNKRLIEKNKINQQNYNDLDWGIDENNIINKVESSYY